MTAPDVDVAIVGAGAAGLATAIFTKRLNPAVRLAIFDGKARPGAKILVSGGSRCNVTNTEVSASDFNGGNATAIGTVLRALPVAATVAFFREIGVALHEEPGGKLFPDGNRSRDVLDALLRELHRSGAQLRAGIRVGDIVRTAEAFALSTSEGPVTASAIVLATGGLSLPKTGSDGWGYGAAAKLGHSIVPTTPALVPLTLKSESPDEAPMHSALSGISHQAGLELLVNGRVARRVEGALLWTHTGISGPAALDMSRHWLRSRLEGHKVSLHTVLCTNHDFGSLDRVWLGLRHDRPRLGVEGAFARFLPRAVADAITKATGMAPGTRLASLTREDRRRAIHALLGWPLHVTGSRGYNYAEVTAGGVDLAEISPRTMESRVCPGLFLVGEVLDVDGRIGGFNFQWAWSSGRAAAGALAAGTARRREVP